MRFRSGCLKDSWQLNREVFIDQKPAYYRFAQTTLQLTGEELFTAP